MKAVLLFLLVLCVIICCCMCCAVMTYIASGDPSVDFVNRVPEFDSVMEQGPQYDVKKI